MTKVFTNISALYQTREHSEQIARGTFMAEVPSIENAFIKLFIIRLIFEFYKFFFLFFFCKLLFSESYFLQNFALLKVYS